MRREERVTVQGPVKEQQPDGMSHRGHSSTRIEDAVLFLVCCRTFAVRRRFAMAHPSNSATPKRRFGGCRVRGVTHGRRFPRRLEAPLRGERGGPALKQHTHSGAAFLHNCTSLGGAVVGVQTSRRIEMVDPSLQLGGPSHQRQAPHDRSGALQGRRWRYVWCTH